VHRAARRANLTVTLDITFPLTLLHSYTPTQHLLFFSRSALNAHHGSADTSSTASISRFRPHRSKPPAATSRLDSPMGQYVSAIIPLALQIHCVPRFLDPYANKATQVAEILLCVQRLARAKAKNDVGTVMN
jgi:hypothetical protein